MKKIVRVLEVEKDLSLGEDVDLRLSVVDYGHAKLWLDIDIEGSNFSATFSLTRADGAMLMKRLEAGLVMLRGAQAEKDEGAKPPASEPASESPADQS